jgi:hypothetical protein
MKTVRFTRYLVEPVKFTVPLQALNASSLGSGISGELDIDKSRRVSVFVNSDICTIGVKYGCTGDTTLFQS